MEKLEEILRAEEDARHLLGQARDRAAEIARQASAGVERIHAEARNSAKTTVATDRAATLRNSDEEAAAVAAEAERELGAVVRTAESRIDTAVDRLITEITG